MVAWMVPNNSTKHTTNRIMYYIMQIENVDDRTCQSQNVIVDTFYVTAT